MWNFEDIGAARNLAGQLRERRTRKDRGGSTVLDDASQPGRRLMRVDRHGDPAD
jgi:hypothetical protein